MTSLLLGLALLLVAPAFGDAGETPVYTNADLEKFGPPSETAPVPIDEDASWEFVGDFLAREQAKIESERAADLARREVEIKQDRPPRLPRYRPAYPVYGNIHVGYHPHPFRIAIPYDHPRARPVKESKKKLLGSDAFPSNRRRAEREARR